MSDTLMLIDKERFDFLFFVFFGSAKKPFPKVSKLAYRDLCRTLHLCGKNGDTCRTQVDTLLEKHVVALLASDINTQLEYDRWHKGICLQMINIYEAADIAFTFGHAQKWINMTMKYLFIHGTLDLSRVFAYLHVPVDSYVFSAVEYQLGINRPYAAWSKITDYNVYLAYQCAIRDRLQNQEQPVDPLRWEFSNWLFEAQKQ